MLYAILAYHEEQIVASWSPKEDTAVMEGLMKVHERLDDSKSLGPAARLGPTGKASTLRRGIVVDGPFAETKESMLGLYVVDCASHAAAVDIARQLQAANETAVYEIREILTYIPGASVAEFGAPQAADA